MTSSDTHAAEDLVRSGGSALSANSTRSGYLPINITSLPLQSLDGIAIYLRGSDKQSGEETSEPFTLYRGADVEISEDDRKRLLDNNVAFVYIRMADQSRFNRQVEQILDEIVENADMAASQKAELVYQTSVELINELLSDPDLNSKSPRLNKVSRAVSSLVVDDSAAFSHLFTASQHDFYTATHMVNVATWMVPLAHEMGHTDMEELSLICQAGMLHDMGKLKISDEILNKSGKLSDEEWTQIHKHPEWGHEYLSAYEHIDEIIRRVTLEHHEREDGTGYPNGLKGNQLHPVSRICAVVDSFDAMTAFRPFKEKTLSVDEAIAILKDETPAKYSEQVMNAWLQLIRRSDITKGVDTKSGMNDDEAASTPQDKEGSEPQATAGGERREHERYKLDIPASVHLLRCIDHEPVELPPAHAVTHSISKTGLGFLSRTFIPPGELVHVYLRASQWQKRRLEGIIVRCRTHDDGWNEIGMKFIDVAAELRGRGVVSKQAA